MAYNKQTWRDLPDQTTPINSTRLNYIEDGIYNNSVNIDLLKGTILWTNPSPTSDFTAQNITLSSDDYDVLEFYYAFQPEKTQVFAEKTLKGSGVQLNTIINLSSGVEQANGVRQRAVDYINDTTYSIADCLERGVAGTSVPIVRNDRIIPLYVVGYKTGLFNNV